MKPQPQAKLIELINSRHEPLGPRAFFRTAMQAHHAHHDRTRPEIETAARAALELRVGRAFTDTEWAPMRARLLEFDGILRFWDRKPPASKRGNVEVLCQPEA